MILNQDPRTLFPYSDEIWSKIEAGSIWIGMNEDMFLLAVNKRPDNCYSYYDTDGTYEQWVYYLSS